MSSKIKAELVGFDINTSIRDILTKASVFNPYPEKAWSGLLVSRISYPMVDPGLWIKYLATGEVYYVRLPIAYTYDEFSPESTAEESVPSESNRWMSLDEYMPSLSLDFVEKACFKLAKLEPAIERAVVKERDLTGRPVFYSAGESYARIIREAFSLLQTGDYATAWCYVDFACRTGAYRIDGTPYSSPSYQVFEYTNRELGWRACPSLLMHHLEDVYNKGMWTIVNDTAQEVQGWIIAETRIRALDQALGRYSDTARTYVEVARGLLYRRKEHMLEKLMAKSDPQSGSYYSQARDFFVKRVRVNM